MNKLTKLIGVFTASIFLLLSITTSSQAGKRILFSIKGPGSGNPFWASVEKGAKEEAAKFIRMYTRGMCSLQGFERVARHGLL